MEEGEHVISMKLNCLKNFFVKNLFNLKLIILQQTYLI